MIGEIMKKWTLTYVTLLLTAISPMLMADEEASLDECALNGIDTPSDEFNAVNCQDETPTLKLRVATFLPCSDRFTEIYSSALPAYEIEGAWTYGKCYKIWVNIDYFYKKGDSSHLDYYTTIKMANISFGMTITHKLSDLFTAYAGMGPSIGFVAVHNRFTSKHINEKKLPLVWF